MVDGEQDEYKWFTSAHFVVKRSELHNYLTWVDEQLQSGVDAMRAVSSWNILIATASLSQCKFQPRNWNDEIGALNFFALLCRKDILTFLYESDLNNASCSH